MMCDHVYGYATLDEELVIADTYKSFNESQIVKFTYCPYCRVQVHTTDEEQLPLGLDVEDDCIKGGCED